MIGLSAQTSIFSAKIGYAWEVKIVETETGKIYQVITGTAWTFNGAIAKMRALETAHHVVTQKLVDKIVKDLNERKQNTKRATKKEPKMTDPIKEAPQLQQRAKEENVDVFEVLNREAEANPPEGPENPYLDEKGKPYHDTPEED